MLMYMESNPVSRILDIVLGVGVILVLFKENDNYMCQNNTSTISHSKC